MIWIFFCSYSLQTLYDFHVVEKWKSNTTFFTFIVSGLRRSFRKHVSIFNAIEETLFHRNILSLCMLSSVRLFATHGLYPTRLLCPWNLQARILEWVAISYSRGSSQPRDSNPCHLHLLHWQAIIYHSAIWVSRYRYILNKVQIMK